MADQDYDLVVIGGGSAGITAACFSAELGQRVALVEMHRIGDDCTWTGCVPSKTLLKVSRVAHEMRTLTAHAPQLLGACGGPENRDGPGACRH